MACQAPTPEPDSTCPHMGLTAASQGTLVVSGQSSRTVWRHTVLSIAPPHTPAVFRQAEWRRAGGAQCARCKASADPGCFGSREPTRRACSRRLRSPGLMEDKPAVFGPTVNPKLRHAGNGRSATGGQTRGCPRFGRDSHGRSTHQTLRREEPTSAVNPGTASWMLELRNQQALAAVFGRRLASHAALVRRRHSRPYEDRTGSPRIHHQAKPLHVALQGDPLGSALLREEAQVGSAVSPRRAAGRSREGGWSRCAPPPRSLVRQRDGLRPGAGTRHDTPARHASVC